MKFKYLKLINFQAHKELLVKLSPGITTIVGASDVGKSAIIRALGWVCLNNLPGDEFITEGEKKTTVILKTEEHRITRTRSAGGAINSYRLDDDELKAFGQGVPKQIADHLAISDLNFQLQHDPPFWFRETAGEVSRQLNAIIDLSVIDSSLAYVGSLVRENVTAEKLCKERLEKVTQELTELEPQRTRIKEFERLEKLKEKADERDEKAGGLTRILHEIESNHVELFLKHQEDVQEVFAKAREARRSQVQADELAGLIVHIEGLKRTSSGPPDFDAVEQSFTDWKDYAEFVVKLEEQIMIATRALETKEQAEKRLADADDTLVENTRGERCPLCGNQI